MDKKKGIIILAIVIFVIFLIGMVMSYQKIKDKFGMQEENTQNTVVNENKTTVKKAKDFRILDEQKNEKTLEDFAGKPLVINTWTTWCGYCEEEMPDFNTLYEQYKDKVEFLMVDILDGASETMENGIQYRNQKGYNFPIYFDKEFTLIYGYGLTGYPNTIFLDKDHNISNIHYGYITKDKLIKNIEKIIK